MLDLNAAVPVDSVRRRTLSAALWACTIAVFAAALANYRAVSWTESRHLSKPADLSEVEYPNGCASVDSLRGTSTLRNERTGDPGFLSVEVSGEGAHFAGYRDCVKRVSAVTSNRTTYARLVYASCLNREPPTWCQIIISEGFVIVPHDSARGGTPVANDTAADRPFLLIRHVTMRTNQFARGPNGTFAGAGALPVGGASVTRGLLLGVYQTFYADMNQFQVQYPFWSFEAPIQRPPRVEGGRLQFFADTGSGVPEDGYDVDGRYAVVFQAPTELDGYRFHAMARPTPQLVCQLAVRGLVPDRITCLETLSNTWVTSLLGAFAAAASAHGVLSFLLNRFQLKRAGGADAPSYVALADK